MPHISKKKLKKEYLQKLFGELSEVLERSAKKSWTRLFLQEFLTETEKIMLSKRFAVIYLLSEGVPQSYIYESLGMSPSTVARMSLKYEIGKYDDILKIAKKEKEDVWNILEKILRAGLPPIAGRGRWKFLHQYEPVVKPKSPKR